MKVSVKFLEHTNSVFVNRKFEKWNCLSCSLVINYIYEKEIRASKSLLTWDILLFLRFIIAVQKDEFKVLWLFLYFQNALVSLTKKLEQQRESFKSELSETLKEFW